jgi:hypothetical protein
VKEECLFKLILFGERSLKRALTEFFAHFHSERNHQDKTKRPTLPGPGPRMPPSNSPMSRAPQRLASILMPSRVNTFALRGHSGSNTIAGLELQAPRSPILSVRSSFRTLRGTGKLEFRQPVVDPFLKHRRRPKRGRKQPVQSRHSLYGDQVSWISFHFGIRIGRDQR